MAPKSVTLNDFERRRPSGRYFYCVILSNSIAFGASYVKMIEDVPIRRLQLKCSQRNLVLAVYDVFADLTENERINERHPLSKA